ncbi:hypothetical protein INR49_030991 [Caranx melampygus]|nr:hypothetical protein INR49_030991 [Caranx melampygus]
MSVETDTGAATPRLAPNTCCIFSSSPNRRYRFSRQNVSANRPSSTGNGSSSSPATEVMAAAGGGGGGEGLNRMHRVKAAEITAAGRSVGRRYLLHHHPG